MRAAIVALCLFAPAAAEPLDRWKGFAPGAWYTMTSQLVERDGQVARIGHTTGRLTGFDGTVALVEQTYRMEVKPGRAVELPQRVMTIRVPADAPLFPGTGKSATAGHEDLRIGSRTVRCRKATWSGTSSVPTTCEAWLSDEVPGRVVKRRDVQDGSVDTPIVTTFGLR